MSPKIDERSLSCVIKAVFQAVCEMRKAEHPEEWDAGKQCGVELVASELGFVQARCKEEVGYNMCAPELQPLWKAYCRACAPETWREAKPNAANIG
jgi:hypothetical protein